MRSIRPVARQNSPNAAPRAAFSRKSSPCTPQNANFGSFFVRWANFFAHTPTIRPAGRTFSRTGHGHVPTLKPITPLQPLMQASMKPPAPLLAPKQRPLKPATPLQPKNAPKTPISRPQRRWRFQLGLSLREQRRRRFHARDFQCPRAMAGPGRASRRRAERSSRRGRRAGGPPPTGAPSSPARRVRPSGARNTCGQANRPYSPPPGSGRPV